MKTGSEGLHTISWDSSKYFLRLTKYWRWWIPNTGKWQSSSQALKSKSAQNPSFDKKNKHRLHPVESCHDFGPQARVVDPSPFKQVGLRHVNYCPEDVSDMLRVVFGSNKTGMKPSSRLFEWGQWAPGPSQRGLEILVQLWAMGILLAVSPWPSSSHDLRCVSLMHTFVLSRLPSSRWLLGMASSLFCWKTWPAQQTMQDKTPPHNIRQTAREEKNNHHQLQAHVP